MADSNYSNSSEDKGLAQDDPFAELTRIMGHDPRPVRKPEPERDDSAEDLALDLENELMGSLTDGDDADRPSGSEDRWTRGHAAAGDDEQEPSTEAPPAREDFDPSQLSAIFEEAFLSHETPEEGAAVEPDADQGYSSESERDSDAYDQGFDTPRDGDAPDEDDGQPMRFVSFRNAAPLIPALAAALQREAQEKEEAWEDGFAAPWDETESQPATGEGEARLTESGTTDRWHGEDAAQEGEAEFSQPEVETVDVPGEKIAATDNLDLPEVRYGEENAKSEIDEIEELLADAFSAPGLETEPPQQTAAAEREARDSAGASTTATDWPFDDDLTEFAADQDAAPTQNDDEFAFDSLNDLHSQHSHRTDSGRESAAAAAMAPAAAARPPRKSGKRSGKGALWASAAVLCLLLVGGGAMYFGFGADADSGAVIVQADNEPVKIKPEDPGGTTIPNQDNQVYKRVSGEDAEPEPSETRLVSTAEEPVELPGVRNVQDDESEVAEIESAVSETGQAPQTAISQPGDTSAKIDDRLQNTIAEEPPEGEVAALEPRRVRSLVVRPDGSMVPREMPEPVMADPVAPPEASAPDGQNSTATNGANQQTAAAPGETGAQAAQSDATAEPEADTAAVQQTEGTPVPASRPANPSPATRAQEPAATEQPQAPDTQVAAASPEPAQPAAAAATTASEWSVQIASQPSVEGAQQSYQQLAQRYGNLLQGRGVNIIKAEIAGKGTYYRVRIPSSSKDDAIRLCEQLKSAGGNCFVSK